MPIAVYEILLRIIGLVLAAMGIVIVLQNRTAGAAWLGGPTRTASVRVRLADVWHLVAILVIVVLFLVWAFAIPGGIEFLLRGILATGPTWEDVAEKLESMGVAPESGVVIVSVHSA